MFMLAGFYANVWYRMNQSTDSTVGVNVPEDGELVTTLPEFTLVNPDGAPVSISTYTGGPLLINFWATWCGPCIREMPLLESIWQEYGASMDLTVVGVAVDRMEDVGPYLEKTGVTYPIMIGQSSRPGTGVDCPRCTTIRLRGLNSAGCYALPENGVGAWNRRFSLSACFSALPRLP